LIGEPVDPNIDVGLALYEGQEVQVFRYTGSSILALGERTDDVETAAKILAPLAQSEVGTIRCIGLNVRHPLFNANIFFSN
jgi:hypothetical protein